MTAGCRRKLFPSLFAAVCLNLILLSPQAYGQTNFPYKDWTRIWGSGAAEGEPMHALVVDDFDNIYVAGSTLGSFGGQTNVGLSDLCLTKFSPTGSTLWVRIWGSTGNEYQNGVALDAAGNVYVSGRASGSFGGQTNVGAQDLCLTKFSSDGSNLWTRIWGSPVMDYGGGVVVDGAGNAYVAGYTFGAFGGNTNSGVEDVCLTKFSSDGSNLWTRIWGSAASDAGLGIAMDSSNNVYVGGYTKGSFDGEVNTGLQDLYVTKWSDVGSKIWTRIWGSAGNEYGYGVAVDSAHNVYVAGHSDSAFGGESNSGGWDSCLTKLSVDGSNLWTRMWGASASEASYSARVDAFDDVYVVGLTDGSFDGQTNIGAYDLLAKKFSTDGTSLWTRIWGSAAIDNCRGVAFDSLNNVYLSGYTAGAFDGQTNAGGVDFCLTKWIASPPPLAIANNPPFVMSGTEAVMYGNLISTGGAPAEVSIYWGMSDGGTVKAGWDTNNYWGFMPPGVISNYAGGLLPGTMYYYRTYASNAFGEAWAPSTTNFMTFGSGGGAHFEVYGIPSSPIFTGQYVNVTIEAWQGTNIWTTYTGTAMFSSSDLGAALPGNYTFTVGDFGVHTFSNQLSFSEAGDRLDVNVEDTIDSSMAGGVGMIAVFSGYDASQVDWFAIWGFDDPVKTGEWHSISIAAVDNNFALYTNYTGTILFTSSDPSAALPMVGSANYSFISGDGGWHSFSNDLLFGTIGEHWLRVEDSVDSNKFNEIWNMTVQGVGSSTNVDHFAVELPHYVGTNEWVDLVVEARDIFENTFTGFVGTLNITCSDPSAIYPPITFTGPDEGFVMAANSVQFATPGIHYLEVAWALDTNVMGGVYGIEVDAGGPMNGRLAIVAPVAVMAGEWATFGVMALDDSGFIDVNYNKSIVLWSDDPGVVFGQTGYVFTAGDMGMKVFSNGVRFATGGDYLIQVQENGNPGMSAAEDIQVFVGGATTTTFFNIVVNPNPAVSNLLSDVFVVALGPGGLVNTNHSGPVVFTSSDSSATFVVNPFSGFVKGLAQITNQVQLVSPGQHTVTVALQSDTNICGTVDVLVVGGGTFYYVNVGLGSDANSGLSFGLPWQTLNRASSNAGPGDVVFVAPGYYQESVKIQNGGVPGQQVTFLADQDGRYFLGTRGDIMLDPLSGPGFEISGWSYITISGFTICGGPGVTGIWGQACSGLMIHDNAIDNCDDGIYLDSVTDSVMEDNSILKGTGAGIMLVGGSDNNVLFRNEVEEYSFGIIVNGSTNVLIDDCWIELNTNDGVVVESSARIEMAGTRLIGNGAYGILVQSGGIADIHNNVAYMNMNNGIGLVSAGPGCKIVNNTCVSNLAGIVLSGSGGTAIRNNITAFNATDGLFLDGISTNGSILEFNCSYGNAANWVGVAPGLGSFSADPLFVSLILPDVSFHLMSTAGSMTPNGWSFDASNSPCIDAGKPASPFLNEPMPNGGRINVGVYGNTREASKSAGPGSVQLVVSSMYGIGTETPPVGTNVFGFGANVLCQITNDVINVFTQYVCVGWSGSGSVPISGTSNSVSIALTNNSSIMWLWNTNYDLNVTPNPNGTVDVTNGWYPLGSNVLITATPSNAYSFIGWIGDVVTNANPLILTMNQAYMVTPVFVLNTNSLLVSSLYGTPAPITGTTWYVEGSLINAWVPTPVPDGSGTQRVCLGWAGTGSVPALGPTNAVSFNITNNSTLSWNWQTEYDVFITPDPNGTVDVANGWYIQGSNVVITATPTNGFSFIGWTGDVVTNANPLVLTMNRSYTVAPTFFAITNSLTVSSLYGTPSPAAGVTWFVQGAVVAAEVPDSPVLNGATQYVCTGWTGSGSVPALGSTTNAPFTINVNSTITWTWQSLFFLNPTAGANGTVDVGSGWRNNGAVVAITATPGGGYHFNGWTGDVPPVNMSDNPLTLTMSQARAVTANFAVDLGSVSVTISPASAVAAGAQWRMTTGPDTTWHNTGDVIPSVPGSGMPYTVQFSPVAGWTAPADISTIGIVDGSNTLRTATYLIGDMVLITGGTYQMGIYGGSGGHSVTLSDFYLDRKEVTVGRYQAFCIAAGSSMPQAPAWGWGNTNRPIVNVTWAQANAYAVWAGKRLPTEAEFEFAMRGGVPNQLYPSGNSIGAGDANYAINVGTPTVAGAYPATGYGLFDIAGNVWEWCSDWYANNLTGPVADPTGPGSGSTRVIRSGSWVTPSTRLLCAARYELKAGLRYADLGFRCASTSVAAGGAGTEGDTNGNGIPDWWEMWYFGAGSGSGGTFSVSDDADVDGHSNLEEFIAGTDPTQSSSVLELNAAQSASAGAEFVIRWSSVAGKLYTVERSTGLTGGFAPIATDVSATPPQNTYTDPASGEGPYYYRIIVQQ